MQPVIDFVMLHQVALAVALMGLADLAVELNPKIEANGVFSAIYNLVKSIAVKKDKPQ